MTMSNEEIVRDYNQASNKSKQIRILADLNCCSPSEIRQVLATILHRRVERLRRIKSCMTAQCGHCTIMAGVAGVKMPERIVKRKPEAQEPEQQCSGLSGPSIYDRIETILTALLEDATKYVRNNAYNLVVALFSGYVESRLGKKVQNEADADH